MLRVSDFKVGQKVVVVDNHQYGDGQQAVVSKVGWKYVTVQWYSRERYFGVGGLEDAKYLLENTDYGTPAMLFPSEEVWKEEKERAELEREIRSASDWRNMTNLSLDQLRRINAILRETE